MAGQLLLGRELGEVRILNVDLSTITTEADSVLLVQEAERAGLFI